MIDRETAARLLMQKAVLDELDGANKELRKETAAELLPGDSVAAAVAGCPLGKVSMSKPREYARVDERELLAWALVHRPEEVETVQRVRAGFVKAIQDAHGHLPERVDHETGEVIPACDVPGVTVTRAEQGVLTVAPTIDARIIARVWVNQLPEQLATETQPEIESGAE